MKKIKIISLILITILLTACTGNDNIKFKESYESLNGEKNKNNQEYRVIEVDKNNPFVYSNLKEINKKIENKETFIVYFGANWCPWCRSILNEVIKEAKEAKIEKIYYIDVRPNNDEEKDIRDAYDVDEKGKIYLSHEGTKEYHKFLKYADSVLNEYDSYGISVKGTKYEGAKRVGAPSYIIIKDGKVKYLEEGISKKLTDPYMELTDEIIKDTDKIFKEFFKKYNEDK